MNTKINEINLRGIKWTVEFVQIMGEVKEFVQALSFRIRKYRKKRV